MTMVPANSLFLLKAGVTSTVSLLDETPLYYRIPCLNLVSPCRVRFTVEASMDPYFVVRSSLY